MLIDFCSMLTVLHAAANPAGISAGFPAVLYPANSDDFS
jgi:hypothetical protein